MRPLSRVLPLVLLALGVLAQVSAGPVFTTAGGPGTTDDLFDLASGTQVIYSTPQHNSCCGNSDPRSIFGFAATGAFVEPTAAIFGDGASAGTVDFIEFQTATPVDLTRIALRLSQDGGGNPYRGATMFRLWASADGLTFGQISGGTIPSDKSGNLNVPLLVTDQALVGPTTNVRAFRLEVTRATTGGVRVIELDATGTPGTQAGPFLDRLAFNATGNTLSGRGGAALDDEGPGLATNFKVSSRLSNIDTPEDAFGHNHGVGEPDTFIFGDGGTPDNRNLIMGDGGETVDFIAWRTIVPVTLAGYRLAVAGDGAGPNRDTALVRFLVNGVELDRFHNSGHDGGLTRLFATGAVVGDDFRLELTRTSASGPRVVEIDAVTAPLPLLNAGVRINEVVASNDQSRLDEDGDAPDWIELFNASDSRINLGGWGLSDRPAVPFKWTFPNVSLPPRGYLVVFASGKNRQVLGAPLHTNFQLASEGETLVLTTSAGTVADLVPAVRLRRDVSHGRQPDGIGEWKFFAEPTPLGPNVRTAYTSLVFEAPAFSAPAGFYTDALALSFSTTEPEVTIHYTLDNSEPTEMAPRFLEPLAIMSRAGQSNEFSMIRGTSTANQHTDGWKPPVGEVRKATVVRARALRPGALPGPVATHTYFIGPEAARSDGLPVFAIATDPAGLFDYTTGIYMLGAIFDQYVAAHPGEPLTGHTPANYTQRGPAWERAAQVEYFEPGGQFAFEEPVALDIQGQSSRSFRQKSFGLKGRGDGPQASTFAYPLFPGLQKLGDGTPLTEFRHLRLRNSGNDWDYAMMRDDWCHRLVSGLGLDIMSSRPVVIYLDGEYWGVLGMREQQDPRYIEAHYGVNPDEVVILYGEGGLEEGQPGDERAFRDLRSYAATHNLALTSNCEYVRQRMDLDDFILYQLAEIYFANADWPQNNMRVWRRRLATPDLTRPRGQDGRWRWFLFDVDLGAAHPWSAGANENTLAIALSPTGRPGFDTPWATAFLRALLANPGFKNDFLNTAADLLNSYFSATRAVTLVNTMEAELLPAMREHVLRWQANGGTVARWRDRVRVVRDFASQRTAKMRAHFVSTFGLSGTAQLNLDVRSPAGGTVRVNRITIDDQLPGANAAAPLPWSGSYFKGIPITLEARAAAGYRFVGWTGAAGLPLAPQITLTLSTNLSLVAQFVPLAAEITAVDRPLPDVLRLQLRGAPNEIYVLQSSMDLVNWTDLQTFTNSAAGMATISTSPDPVDMKRFYRVRSQ